MIEFIRRALHIKPVTPSPLTTFIIYGTATAFAFIFAVCFVIEVLSGGG